MDEAGPAGPKDQPAEDQPAADHRAGPEVTLVRHGETPWSKSGQHTGLTDLDLTPTGEAQAVSVRSLLSGTYDLILVSPLARARRTAQLCGLTPFEVDGDLLEWDYGSLEGLTTPQIRQRLPGWSIWKGPWPEGETLAKVQRRADRVVRRVVERPSGSRVAIVAHGHILRVLAARWLGVEASAGRYLALDTATISELGWEHASPVLRCWNQPAHDAAVIATVPPGASEARVTTDAVPVRQPRGAP